jgi:protein-disulfide isomerase
MAKSNKRRDDGRRSAAAAAKAAEMRRAQLAAERRRRTLAVSAIAVGVIVIIVGVFVAIQTRSSAPTVAASGVRGATGNYGFVVGEAGAPVNMVVYEDFQCPVCKSLEVTDGAMLNQKIADGTVKIEYRPIAILDRASTTSYSSRALNAAACVRNDSTSTVWKAYHDLLFKQQPEEGSAGLTDAQLTTLATQAGAKAPAVGTCIADDTFKNWASSATEASSKDGVSGTPTVRLNGVDIDVLPDDKMIDATALGKLIDDAAKGGTP